MTVVDNEVHRVFFRDVDETILLLLLSLHQILSHPSLAICSNLLGHLLLLMEEHLLQVLFFARVLDTHVLLVVASSSVQLQVPLHSLPLFFVHNE